MMKFFFKIIFIFSGLVQIQAQSKDSLSAFANSLYQQKQYQFAALEYQRLLFFDASDTFARVQLLKSLNRSGQYRSGIEGFNKYNADISFAPQGEAMQYGLSLLHTQRYDSLYLLLSLNKKINESQRLCFQSSQQLLQGQYLFSYALLSKNTSNDNTIVQLRDLSNEALNTRFKSPGLAVAMSAIVPGSGQCYGNQWREGLVTLVASLLSGYKVYSDLKEGRKTSGVIYGASFSLLYFYSLISAAESAQSYNKGVRERYSQKTYEIFDQLFQ